MKITDANIVFDEEKMYMQGMDNSQIGLFELKLLAHWFQEYDVTQPVTLGINCELFHKMLHCIDRSQNIIITFEEDGDNIDIQLTSEENGIIDKHFRLPLMDIDIPLMQIPPTEYTADIILAANVLFFIQDVIKLTGLYQKMLHLCIQVMHFLYILIN